jgi:hypothetical protein
MRHDIVLRRSLPCNKLSAPLMWQRRKEKLRLLDVIQECVDWIEPALMQTRMVRNLMMDLLDLGQMEHNTF